MAASSTPYFQNDMGLSKIEIGSREFMCVGAKPPYDHPWVLRMKLSAPTAQRFIPTEQGWELAKQCQKLPCGTTGPHNPRLHHS
jgi:uncharacterized Zn-finger protein